MNDFGFTFVNEDEIDQPVKNQVLEEVDALKLQLQSQEKVFKFKMKAVDQFLEHLKANPEKDYIKWPNRVKAVEKFQKELKS